MGALAEAHRLLSAVATVIGTVAAREEAATLEKELQSLRERSSLA